LFKIHLYHPRLILIFVHNAKNNSIHLANSQRGSVGARFQPNCTYISTNIGTGVSTQVRRIEFPIKQQVIRNSWPCPK